MRKILIIAILIFSAIITASPTSAATLFEQSDDLTETNWQSWSSFIQTFVPSEAFNTLVFKVYDTVDNAYFIGVHEVDPITQESNLVGSASYVLPEEPGSWSNLIVKFTNDITPVSGKIYKAYIGGRSGYSFKMKGSDDEESYPDGELSTGSGYESTLGNVKDLYFKIVELPRISEANQYKSNGITILPPGEDIGEEKAVVVKANITSPVEEDITVQLRINGELIDSDIVVANEEVSFEYDNIPSGEYQWYLNAIDENNNETGLVYGSAFETSDIPFAAESLQLSVDEGDSASGNSITIRETLYDRDEHQVKLQVELREINQPFTGVEDGMIQTSEFIDSEEYTDITFSDLYKRKYHWRSRVIDSENNISSWREFGITGNVDFMIGDWTESSPVEQLEAVYQSPYTTSNIFQSLGNGLSGTATSIKLRSSTNWGNPRRLDIRECDSNVIGFDVEFPPGCSSVISGPISVYVGANDYITHSIDVTFNPEKFYLLFFYQDWQLYGSTDIGSYHNGSLGSIGSPNSYDTIGDLKQVYFELEGAALATPQITPFWAKIDNSSGLTLRDKPFIDESTAVKELPNDWVVKVTSEENDYDYDEQAGENDGGYTWYQIVDATDNVSGYLAAKSPEDVIYLDYSEYEQNGFQEIADDEIGVLERPEAIIEAINHYYNDESTTDSLYSSDDNNNIISTLKDNNFSQKVIWGIMAQESGGISGNVFDNENITSDFGHGISQITFSPTYSWDNRGVGSGMIIPKCSISSSLYLNCYTEPDSSYPYYRHYQPYGGIIGNNTFKQYTNKLQSIYANIKDAMHILSNNYEIFSGISGDILIEGITYSENDRKNILTVQHYNGGNDQACMYVDSVADNLENIDDFFPGQSTSDISPLISKMHSAGTDVICADLHSPGNLSAQDSDGRTIGLINGEEKNDFPLALYDSELKFIRILSAGDNDYIFKVDGLEEGKYGLDITIKNKDQITKFNAKDIPTNRGETHIYKIDKQAAEDGSKEAVTIEIDRDSDGKSDRLIKSDITITGETFNQKLK